jgi:CRISPR type III-B/RAMP module-associated protein Cmr5
MANELSTMKSIAQARAKFAWECANVNKNGDYESLVGKIPTYIKTNGLLNTLAFLYSGSKDKNDNVTAKGKVLKNIREWLTHSEYGLISQSINNDELLMKHLTNSYNPPKPENEQVTAKDLIQCTTEVLALFNWLRRFAKSE